MQRQLTDLAKVIAAIAVVGIHATSTAEYNFSLSHNFFSADFAGVLLNQWARFSVPLFLYLSAYGLTVSDKNASQNFAAAYGDFLKKRFPSILIPYLFFSAVALLLNIRNLTVPGVLSSLMRGGADYHLYFLVILAQCYLLFPLLLRMRSRSEKIFRVFTILAFVLVILLLYRTSSERILGYFGFSHPGWHASFCIYWLPYFMLGILHGRQPPAAWGVWTAMSAVGVAFATLLTDYVYASNQKIPVDYYNHFSRPSVALYAVAVIYLLHAIKPHPPDPLSLRRGGAFLRRGEALAPLTFSVYLIHPQVLRLLNWLMPGMASLLYWVMAVAATFALVFALRLVLNRFENRLVNFFQRALGLR